MNMRMPILLLVVSALLTSCKTTPPAAPPLSHNDVLKLASQQRSVDVLRLAVYHSGLDFALDLPALRQLRERGLTAEQIQAVLEGAVALETDAGVPVRTRKTGHDLAPAVPNRSM